MRWRLVAWSGGVTLVVLVVLGWALYATLANFLGTAGRDQLAVRSDEIRSFVAGARRFPDEGAPVGFTIGGKASGTFGFIVGPDDLVIRPGDPTVAGLPDAAGIAAARAGRRDVREFSIEGIPIRVQSDPVRARSGGTYVVQVVQDRTAEQRLLDTVASVLLVGGLIALLGAVGAGTLYAERALVPIRESLRRQREFAADASHELRTPLAVIRSSVDHLERHRDEPVGAVGDAVKDIRDEVEHLTAMVGDLLLLARTDSGAIELEQGAIDLADAAESAVTALTPLATERGVRLLLDPTPAPATGDLARMRQLITILIDNALKHSPTGSTVTVSVGRDGGQARLTVDDEGPGIRHADLPHVFDRFWRAEGAPTGGTGLGLAIARWIVEQHGGTIAASNRQPGGARFDVRVPLRAG